MHLTSASRRPQPRSNSRYAASGCPSRAHCTCADKQCNRLEVDRIDLGGEGVKFVGQLVTGERAGNRADLRGVQAGLLVWLEIAHGGQDYAAFSDRREQASALCVSNPGRNRLSVRRFR